MEKINIDYIKEKLKNSYDVKYREIECAIRNNIWCIY